MKIKLTNSQFTTLYSLVRTLVETEPAQIEDRLHRAVMIDLFKNLHNQILIAKPFYKVTFSEPQAVVFFIKFHDHKLPPTHFTGNLLNTIILKLHQKLYSQ